MRQKSSSILVHRDFGDFRGVLLIKIQYAEIILACMENKLKEYRRIWRIRREYFALPYMDNTPLDIKLSLSRRIFEEKKNSKNFGT